MRMGTKQIVGLVKVVLLVGVMAVATMVVIGRRDASVLNVEQVVAQESRPVPHIDYVKLNDHLVDSGSLFTSVNITRGQVVTLEMQATNVGNGSGYRVGIYASFPELDGYDDANLVKMLELSTSNDDQDLMYIEHRPRDDDDLIWYSCGSLGYLDVPQYLLIVGYAPGEWEPGEEIYLRVKWRPPTSGTFQVQVKAVVAHEGTNGLTTFYHDPVDGPHTDQQCDDVYRQLVEVAPGADTVYLPFVIKEYPDLPLRGVRMQASSCSDASQCEQRLDCLQAAGVSVIYYTVYYNQAYYHSALLPHRSFDSLDYLVSAAHRRGMRVYPLITVAHIGWPEHPEWNARLNDSRITEDWLDFSNPAARAFVADVAQELVQNYPVEGVLLDYIRWSGPWYQDANLSANDISLTVKGVYERVKATRNVDVTASVFKSRWSGERVGQLWYDWLDGSYIDYVTPMAYVSDSELEAFLDEWQNSVHFPERIHPRLAVVWFEPTRAKSVTEVLDQIEMCDTAGSTGIALWDDRYICNNPDLVQALGAGGW